MVTNHLPEPYYVDEDVTIFCGDCEDIIPNVGTVDITFSSPPYNQIPKTRPSGLLAESKRKLNAGYETHSDDMPEMEYQSWMQRVFSLCREVSKGLIWVNHKTRFRDKSGIHPLQFFDWPFYSEIVWDRGGSLTLNARKFAPSHEYIYGFGIPHFWDDSMNTMLSVWRIPPEKHVNGHPCPFPVEIARRCIVASCPEGGVVLDPFMGSGTTLLAARKEGRKSIGIEINASYCEIAVKRLLQRQLF